MALRAQLSNYEILLLAYNGMQPYAEKFTPLIHKYELLKNLNNEKQLPKDRGKRIVDLEVLKDEYPHLKMVRGFEADAIGLIFYN